MVALELVPHATFDPAAYTSWLEAQPDMGTKWAPRFVRISASLPQTATGKVTKVDLRREAWVCDEAIWWRPLGSGALHYRLLTESDRMDLAQGLSDHGRPPLSTP
jgi:fatty-acyl-CoA synthase